MMFKVGDLVRVKDDLENGYSYGCCDFVEHMKKYVGKKFKIIEVKSGGHHYKLEDCGDWDWSEEMFELVKKIKLKADKNGYI